jgi:hypothetical protein
VNVDHAHRAVEKLGLVWDLKQPPARVLEEGRALDAARRSARSA